MSENHCIVLESHERIEDLNFKTNVWAYEDVTKDESVQTMHGSIMGCL